MWKAVVLLLTFHWCGINARNIQFTEWPPAQQQPVHQPSYYSEYAPLLHDLSSYQRKLHQQGLTPTYGQDILPSITMENVAENHQPYPYSYNQAPFGQAPHYQAPYYHPTSAVIPSIAPSTEHKGKHKCSHIVKTDTKNESEHAKKPIHEIDIKWPHIKHDNLADKQHANTKIVERLNETINKISDKVEVRVSTIKQFLDKSIDNINKTADGVYQQIGNESSKLIDRINKKLKGIEKQLERLKYGSVRRVDDDDDDDDENSEDDEDFGDATRSIDSDRSIKPDEVHSEKVELLDVDLRGDVKSYITEAMKNAQDRFNKLIDEQAVKINKKVTDITVRFEAAFANFQDVFAKIPMPTPKPKPTKIYTPPTYGTTTPKPTPKVKKSTIAPRPKLTTVTWKPKATAPTKPTTPEYFRYTTASWLKYEHEKSESDQSSRMDMDVDALKIVDDARSESTKSGDESVKLEPSVAVADQIDNEAEGKDSQPIDGFGIEVDTGKALDDLQSQVLANVKDTLRSDGEDLKAIENNQTEVLENPDDKLKSDTVAKDIETTLAGELRSELKEDKLLDENSNIDNSRAANLDDSAETTVDIEEIAGAATSQSFDDSGKLLEIDEDDDIDNDGNEMRSLEETPIENSDDDEDSQLTQPNHAGSLRFDELEVIQLIPVIIEQLRSGHVSKVERVALEQIFGDLWSLIVAESQRSEGEEMNAMLRTILQSEEVRLAKRDITKQIGNDIYKNSVRRVYRGDDEKSPKPYLSLDDDRKSLSPAERLLKMVAAIVHKANTEKRAQAEMMQKRKRRNMRKKNQKNPLGIVTVEKPRQRFMDRIFSINRMKRSIIKFTSDLSDMKVLLEQVNQANDFEENENDHDFDDSNSSKHLDDYADDDYYFDDDEYQMSPESDYPSEKIASNQRNYFDDYEDGSVNEFIQLAKQRDRREKSAAQENFNDSYEDDDDDY